MAREDDDAEALGIEADPPLAPKVADSSLIEAVGNARDAIFDAAEEARSEGRTADAKMMMSHWVIWKRFHELLAAERDRAKRAA
ncbi:MAG TPA: hypothetical protein VD970_10835 [Acetobacteraceae bacterium]|nr:hypothetical protein [Acetobacteraceae bacterium]